LTTGCIV